MNSTILRLLALLFAFGAIVIGYLGFQASRQPPQTTTPVAPKLEAPGEPVVFANRTISPGQVISAQDLSMGRVPMRPVRAYGEMRDLIGKRPKAMIPAGEMLLASQFPSHSQLAQSINEGERAVAIKVDETIGTGGFLEPGDRVDVLLYLRADGQEIGEDSSAQIILSDIRLLSFGNILETPVENPSGRGVAAGENATNENAIDNNPATDANIPEKPTAKSSKTAVLAVPIGDATKLMLADSSGSLRLALHGAVDENQLSLVEAGTGGRQIVNKGPEGGINGFLELHQLIRKKDVAKSSTHAAGPQAVVHRGTHTETIFLSP
ncbi:MAG: Flp pilus assembly protein CpaB [Methylococcales bacterium]